MVVMFIGSTGLRSMMEEKKKEYEKKGIGVLMPCFDDYEGSELEICKKNIENIKKADYVEVFWDGRSVGTVFDLGACLALGKKIKIGFLSKKSLINLVKEMEKTI